MSYRIDTATFAQICHEELERWGADAEWSAWALAAAVAVDQSPEEWPLAELDVQTVVLHRKPIQSLVDTEEALREIVRNLIRWGLERLKRSALGL